jgi:hypothetical protein
VGWWVGARSAWRRHAPTLGLGLAGTIHGRHPLYFAGSPTDRCGGEAWVRSGLVGCRGSGGLWRGRYPLAATLWAVSFEADQAAQVLPDPGVVVLPVVAVHGAQVPWGKVVMDGVPVVAARRLPSMLRALRRCWVPSGSPPWPPRPGSASTPPLDPYGLPSGHPPCCWWPSAVS